MATKSATANQPHVPAWKRLGLKLKYAKDTAAPDNGPSKSTTTPELSSDAPATKKRDRDDDVTSAIEDRSSKKSRKNHEKSRESKDGGKAPASLPPASTATSKQIEVNRNYGFGATHNAAVASNKHTRFGNDSDQEDASKTKSQSPDKDGSKRRKSVSFTSDTKRDDGFSAQNHFKQWAAQQKDADSAAATSTEQSAPSPPAAKAKEKKLKPPPKAGEGKKSKSKPKAESKDTAKYITYLETFANDKDNWKFSKATQNDVLKNVWNTSRIPIAHNPALFAYISGLQGNAARQRLIEGARATLQEVEDKFTPDIESSEARKAAYEAARQRDWDLMIATGAREGEQHQQEVEDIRHEAERGRRAERIMSDLLAQALGYPRPGPTASAEPAAAAIATAAGAATAAAASETEASKKRKRKARTEVSSSSESSSSESDSDSSSSDSSSDSSDEESPSEEEKPAKKKPVFDAESLSKAFPKQSVQPAAKPAAQKTKNAASSSSKSGFSEDSKDSDSSSSSGSSDSDSSGSARS